MFPNVGNICKSLKLIKCIFVTQEKLCSELDYIRRRSCGWKLIGKNVISFLKYSFGFGWVELEFTQKRLPNIRAADFFQEFLAFKLNKSKSLNLKTFNNNFTPKINNFHHLLKAKKKFHKLIWINNKFKSIKTCFNITSNVASHRGRDTFFNYKNRI